MNQSKHYPPMLGQSAYHCPYCNVYAKQLYGNLQSVRINPPEAIKNQSFFSEILNLEWVATKCQACLKIAIWNGKNLVYPKISIAPPPNSDLSEDIQKDYIEAANIFSDSPRAAAALLRLALQKLCKQLGEKGENINEDIKSLVRKGLLNPDVQKSLDVLRITGNNAVHPGEIDLNEKPEIVVRLFGLINFVANKMITEPKALEELYKEMPPSSIDAITKRDK